MMSDTQNVHKVKDVNPNPNPNPNPNTFPWGNQEWLRSSRSQYPGLNWLRQSWRWRWTRCYGKSFNFHSNRLPFGQTALPYSGISTVKQLDSKLSLQTELHWFAKPPSRLSGTTSAQQKTLQIKLAGAWKPKHLCKKDHGLKDRNSCCKANMIGPNNLCKGRKACKMT